jgi:uncharacterized glyoxalase superfamily protein PhnB
VADEKITDPQVIPYLLYADAGAAMDWLVKTFGFTVRARDARQDGTVRHGELQLDGGGVIMVGSAGPGYQGPARLGGATQLVRITVVFHGTRQLSGLTIAGSRASSRHRGSDRKRAR